MKAAIPEIADLADTLKKLDDSELLTRGRGYSYYFEFSIGRWSQRRSVIVYRNMIGGHCPLKLIEKPFKKPIEGNFIPEIDPDVLLSCLSLENVRELANYEQPPVDYLDQIGGRFGKDVDVDLGKLPKGVVAASIAAEGLLLFTLIYFLAFAIESLSSVEFPVPGTLFGAFSKTPMTIAMLFLALCLPAASTLAVAIASVSWPLYVGFGLILLASAPIPVFLNGKSYFSAINPFRWRSHTTQAASAGDPEEDDLPGPS